MMQRRTFVSGAVGGALASWFGLSKLAAQSGQALNFVFIAMDDLAPWPKPFRGYPGTVIAPNIERLAARGVSFQRAYCAVPVSGGSRLSTMSGLAPYRTGIWQNINSLSALSSWAVVNPQLPRHTEPMLTTMRKAGYRLGAAGKIYFGPGFTMCDTESSACATPVKPETCGATSAIGRTVWEANLPVGWDHVDTEPSDIHTNVDSGPFPLPQGLKPAYYWQKAPATGPVEDWSSATCATSTKYDQVPEANFPDVKIAKWATSTILGHTGNTPLFLAAGFLRPHAAWFVPQRFYDLYDDVVVPLRSRSVKSESNDATDMTLVGCLSLRREQLQRPATGSQFATSSRYEEVESGVIKGYLASISFADEQLGKILDAIDASPMRNSTVIVLWGDHGFSFGEKLGWQKQKLYESSCRVPLIISAPGADQGKSCNRVVSLLDLFPTMLDYAGYPRAQWPLLDGESLRPLVERPAAARQNPFVVTAFDFTNRVGPSSGAVADPSCMSSSVESPYARTDAAADPNSFSRGQGSYAIRTERWTFMRYNVDGIRMVNGVPTSAPLFCRTAFSSSSCVGGSEPIENEELYDFLNDPEERTNLLAGSPSPKTLAIASWLRGELTRRIDEARSNPIP